MSTVLVVDDDPSIDHLISLVLVSADINVQRALDGQEALELLDSRQADPDLILLDLNMPRMDGREFFRCARLAGYLGP